MAAQCIPLLLGRGRRPPSAVSELPGKNLKLNSSVLHCGSVLHLQQFVHQERTSLAPHRAVWVHQEENFLQSDWV